MFNKPLQQKYGRQRKLNYRYISIPSVFSLAKKVELIAKTPELWSHQGSVMAEYSVWGQSRGVRYKGNI